MSKFSKEEVSDIISNSNSFHVIEGVSPYKHSRYIDKVLGFKISKIEGKLLKKYRAYDKPIDSSNKKKHFIASQAWIGLAPQVLLTPYSEIYQALWELKNENVDRIIDIGAAYGRVGFVMQSIFPDAEFVGYEIIKSRETEANRVFEKHNLRNCKVLQQNVLEDSFQLPKADIYFIYDFSEFEDIKLVLDSLVSSVDDFPFYIIAKGDRVEELLAKQYNSYWKENKYSISNELKIYSSIKNNFN